MKKILKYKQWIGKFIIILGVGIFSYNILNFSFTDFIRRGTFTITSSGELGNVAYYYKDEVLLLISFGVMLIVAGILIVKNKL